MKLREWREKKGWSQEELAERLPGVPQESVSQWENDGRMPRKVVLKAIMELTNGKVTANDFV